MGISVEPAAAEDIAVVNDEADRNGASCDEQAIEEVKSAAEQRTMNVATGAEGGSKQLRAKAQDAKPEPTYRKG